MTSCGPTPCGADGGPNRDPRFFCEGGGQLLCTRNGEPLAWESTSRGCSFTNFADFLEADGGAVSCPDGYAFFCQVGRACPL